MILRNILYRLRGEVTTERLIQRGLIVGNNLTRMQGTIIDDSHPWLIEIGDNVTLAPRVHILAHDASTKDYLGYTKIGKVIIGDNVFIGAGTVILPGVCIGKNSIIGANSTVTHDIPIGMVAVGNPAHVICMTEEYIAKEKERMAISPCYNEEYTMRGRIDETKKHQQKEDLSKCRIGYVI